MPLGEERQPCRQFADERGAQLVGEVVRYEDAYRLRYIRGPDGLLGLAEELG